MLSGCPGSCHDQLTFHLASLARSSSLELFGERHMLRNHKHVMWVRPENDSSLKQAKTSRNLIHFLQSGATCIGPLLGMVAPMVNRLPLFCSHQPPCLSRHEANKHQARCRDGPGHPQELSRNRTQPTSGHVYSCLSSMKEVVITREETASAYCYSMVGFPSLSCYCPD